MGAEKLEAPPPRQTSPPTLEPPHQRSHCPSSRSFQVNLLPGRPSRGRLHEKTPILTMYCSHDSNTSLISLDATAIIYDASAFSHPGAGTSQPVGFFFLGFLLYGKEMTPLNVKIAWTTIANSQYLRKTLSEEWTRARENTMTAK